MLCVHALLTACTCVNVPLDHAAAHRHHASRNSYNAVVTALLQGGASVNALNAQDKSTPLHLAASKNNAEGVRLLLAARADAKLKNGLGATALDNARRRENHAVVALLCDGDELARRAAAKQLNLQRMLRPTEEERQAQAEAFQRDIMSQRESRRESKQVSLAEREAAKAKEREAAQVEQRRKQADRALARALEPAATKRAASKSLAEPWLDFNPTDHAELRRSIEEAQAAGSATHQRYNDRLRYAVRLLEQLDAHAAGKPIPRAAPISPPKHSSERETDVEKSLRKTALAARMAGGAGRRVTEVRL